MTMMLPEVTPLDDDTPEFDAIVAQFGPVPEFEIPDPIVSWMDEVEKLAEEAAAAIEVPSGPLEGSEEPEMPDLYEETPEAWSEAPDDAEPMTEPIALEEVNDEG